MSDLRRYLEDNLPPAVIARPLDDHPYLNNTQARMEILPPALNAAGLPNFPYTRYHEIAAVMSADEVHQEVREKLDQVGRALNP